MPRIANMLAIAGTRRYSLRIYQRSCARAANARYLTTTASNGSERTVYLLVPFEDKDDAKRLGARWDPNFNKWYINSSQPAHLFDKWTIQYLHIPFRQKEEAKALGARWDPSMKSWCAAKGTVRSNEWLSKCLIDSIQSELTITDANEVLQTSGQATDEKIDKHVGGVLFLDIETNGLPSRWGSNYQDLESYNTARMVEISALLCDKVTLVPADRRTSIIKAVDFGIQNFDIHGITLERSLEEGLDLSVAVERILPMFQNAKYVLAHNAGFDMNVLKSELFRHGLSAALKQIESLHTVCTMQLSKPILRLPSRFKADAFKNPSLKELYEFATEGKELQGHHSAAMDVENLHEAVKALLNRGLIDKTVFL